MTDLKMNISGDMGRLIFRAIQFNVNLKGITKKSVFNCNTVKPKLLAVKYMEQNPCMTKPCYDKHIRLN